MAGEQQQIESLRQLIMQARDNLTGVNLPEGRASRARELLDAAQALADDLVSKPVTASALGAKGGHKTAERGSEFFRQIAAKRKTRGGGRPRSTVD